MSFSKLNVILFSVELNWNTLQKLILTQRKLMLHIFATKCYFHCILILRYLLMDSKKVNASENYAHKSFIKTKFSHNKNAKNTWLACQGYWFEENPATLSTAEIERTKELVKNQPNAFFMEKLLLTASTVIDTWLALLHFALLSDAFLMILSSCPMKLQNTTS